MRVRVQRQLGFTLHSFTSLQLGFVGVWVSDSGLMGSVFFKYFSGSVGSVGPEPKPKPTAQTQTNPFFSTDQTRTRTEPAQWVKKWPVRPGPVRFGFCWTPLDRIMRLNTFEFGEGFDNFGITTFIVHWNLEFNNKNHWVSQNGLNLSFLHEHTAPSFYIVYISSKWKKNHHIY